jgi:hypothetical protein
MGEELACFIHHGDFAAGAKSRVNAKHGDGAGGCGEQQIVQVVAEDLDGVGIGALL